MVVECLPLVMMMMMVVREDVVFDLCRLIFGGHESSSTNAFLAGYASSAGPCIMCFPSYRDQGKSFSILLSLSVQ